MCFSPEMSFGSAAVLIPTGMFCLWTAAKRAPRLWPLAIVPSIFGLQQACEGVVWLGIGCEDGKLCSFAAKLYLFFALAFWPIWSSIAVAIMEPNANRGDSSRSGPWAARLGCGSRTSPCFRA